jgi:hypothetical protein
MRVTHLQRTMVPQMHSQRLCVRVKGEDVQARNRVCSAPTDTQNDNDALLVAVEVSKRDHARVFIETERAGREQRIPGEALLRKRP